MPRLLLRHLTFISAMAEPAFVEFSPHVTVIRGPSDTGKSFIVDAIDFMLGASTLKEIPERSGYSTALLGLELPDGAAVTLSRSVDGGNIGLYMQDVRSGPLAMPDKTLAPKHNATSESNLSRYLLAKIGLDGKRVRRNARNETDSLSFRNLAHLCIVDETQMQSEMPPPLTGNYVSRTKEISVLKLLLQDEDDAVLVPFNTERESSRLSSAKIEAIDSLLAELEDQLGDVPTAPDLLGQLESVDLAIEQQTRSVATLANERGIVAEDVRSFQAVEGAARTDLADTMALRARFRLLQTQYDSDLERLAMLAEVGSLLGYFKGGVCVFCGADPEHQHYNDGNDGNDGTAFGESVQAEIRKTLALRDDLVATLEDVEVRASRFRERVAAARAQIDELQEQLRDLDAQISPQHEELVELISRKGNVERWLAIYAQVANLEFMKLQVSEEVEPAAAAATPGPELSVLREFSAELSRRLADWGFPDAESVRYDRSERDLVAGDQLRSAHGKGVRAILHAAFTLGLAQYCIDRDIPHPGFVVLDSPLVTYRPPDPGEPTVDDESLPRDIVGAFYRDIQRRFDGQVIVMENTDPPEPLRGEAVDIVFTKAADRGRYGYFPPNLHE